jgi:hypothetical protein
MRHKLPDITIGSVPGDRYVQLIRHLVPQKKPPSRWNSIACDAEWLKDGKQFASDRKLLCDLRRSDDHCECNDSITMSAARFIIFRRNFNENS